MDSTPRVQIENLKAPDAIQAQARPVDTFVAPQAPPNRQAPDPNNGLTQLANALSRLNPKLQQFSNSFTQAQVEKQKLLTEQQKREAAVQAGELASKNQTDWNTLRNNLTKQLQNPNITLEQKQDLERQLSYVRGSNPWTRALYEKSTVADLAAGLDQAIRTEWATNPIKESDNLADFDQFFNERVQAGIETVRGRYGDRALAEDFFPALEKTRQALLTEQVNYRQKRVVEDAKDSLSKLSTTKVRGFAESFNSRIVEATDQIAKMSNLTVDQKMEELGKIRDAEYQKWADELSLKAKEALASGLQGKEVNNLLIDSIIAVAAEQKNTKLLKLADHIKTKDGAPIGNIADLKEKLANARRSINSEQWTDIQRQDATEKREREQFLRKSQTEMFKALDTDAWSSIESYKQSFFDRDMGEEWLEIRKVQRKLQEENVNPVAKRDDIAGVGSYVYSGGTSMTPVNKAYLAGKIGKEEYGNYGRTVSINKDREDRDQALATLKRELTDNALKYAKDRFKLKLKYGLEIESRRETRQIQIESEVRRSIDAFIREKEEKGLSPNRNEINDFIYDKLMIRLDKQFPSKHDTLYSELENKRKSSQVINQTNTPNKSSTTLAPPTKASKNQVLINKIKADPRLSPATKEKLIKFYNQ